MESIESIRPFLACLVSLAAMPIIATSGKNPNAREMWTFIAAFVKLGIVVSMLPYVLDGGEYHYTLFEFLPGADIAFRVDSLGMLFALVSSSLWILTSMYSIGYMRAENEHAQTRYFSFFALALFSTVGVAFSANLLTMYLFYEILSLSTYPLVTHHQDKDSRDSGRKYLLFIMGTSIGLALPAMLYAYGLSGDLTFMPQGFLAGTADMTTLAVLLVMLLFGFAKVGVMPVHSWLPAAMVAPTPVSALLHAVAVVKVGAFSIVRVVTGVFGVDLLASLGLGDILLFVAAVTMIAGSLIAMSQDGLKRRLAFSTIAQLSYIVLGMGLLSPKGLTGGMLHIAMHAFGKITLFMCAGAIFVATGKKYISQMVGLGRQMPITMTAFLIGSLSIIGLPPCGGFVSKWFLLQGALEADSMAILIVILGSSLLNTVYFMPIVYRAFFCTPDEAAFKPEFKEAPVACVFPLTVTAICSIVLLFYPQPFLNLAEMTVAGIFGG